MTLHHSRELTDKQKLFADYYMMFGRSGATRAVIKAGYSDKSAHTRAYELVNNPAVRNYMIARGEVLDKQIDMPLDYVLKKLKYVIDTYIPDDKEIKKDEVAVAMSAIREVNQIQGNYAAEKRVNINVNGDEEVKRIREKTEKAIAENKQEY